jgi:hypothetical protein
MRPGNHKLLGAAKPGESLPDPESVSRRVGDSRAQQHRHMVGHAADKDRTRAVTFRVIKR